MVAAGASGAGVRARARSLDAWENGRPHVALVA